MSIYMYVCTELQQLKVTH